MNSQTSAFHPNLARSVSIDTRNDQPSQPPLIRRANVYTRSVSLRNGYNAAEWHLIANGGSSSSQASARRATFSVSKRNYRKLTDAPGSPGSRCSTHSLAGDPFINKPGYFPGFGVEESGNDDALYSLFTKCHTCYELVPTSTKLVVFDTTLSVKKAFFALVQHGIRAAPLWDSGLQTFVGMLTVTDFIHMLRRYYKAGVVGIKELEEHKITTWREVLSNDDMVKPLSTVNSNTSLYDAVRALHRGEVHRLPVMDVLSGNVLYILTAKKIFRFLYPYIRDLPVASFLQKTPKELEIGSWREIMTLREDTKLIEALNRFLDGRVSAVPIVDETERVVAVFAKADVFDLALDKSYGNLDATVEEALKHRSHVSSEPTLCNESDSLATVLRTFYDEKAQRVVIVDKEKQVAGVVSLLDVLAFLILLPQMMDEVGGAVLVGQHV